MEMCTEFANSVVYSQLRVTGPYGGPSVREHVANALLNDSLVVWEEASLQEVYLFLISPIYGALTEHHLRFWLAHKDICHDDDPDDLVTLEKYAAKYKFVTTRIWSFTLENVRRITRITDESIVEALDRVVVQELARLKSTLER